MAEYKANIVEPQPQIKQISESTLKGYTIVMKFVDLMLQRIQNQTDPVIRYSLILDKFSTMLELGFTIATTAEDNIPSDKFYQMNETFNNLQKELRDMAEYIRTPHLSPEHPVGNNMMKSSEAEFKVLDKSLNKK
jgi:hypothetical protein